MPTHVFQLSIETRQLADRLKEVPFGEFIGFQALTNVIGRDVRDVPHLLRSARGVAEREAGAVFGAVRGLGLQRLLIDQVPAVGANARRAIGRKARRATRTMGRAAIWANDMPNATKLQLIFEQSVLGLVQHTVRDSTVRRLVPRDGLEKPLPVAAAAQGLYGIFKNRPRTKT